MADQKVMLILRGVKGKYPDPQRGGEMVDWPDGALDEKSALAYAECRHYSGKVLPVEGFAAFGSPQMLRAMDAIGTDKNIAGLYGFSGGGFNLYHILHALKAEDRPRIQLVVVLGVWYPEKSRRTEADYKASAYKGGSWELVYRKDPAKGHMYGPMTLLEECKGSK